MKKPTAPTSGLDLSRQKVLIVRLSALGDVIRTLPAVVSLQHRFPHAEFHWLVEKPSAKLLEAVPGIKVIAMDRKKLRQGSPWSRIKAFREIVRKIRAEKFAVAIDFHGVLKSGIFAFLARIPIRVGYERGGSKEGHRWLITHRHVMKSKAVSRYQRNRELAEFIDGRVRSAAPTFQLEEAAKAAINVRMESRPIVFFPGTSAHGRNKRWPASYWAELYRRVAPVHPVTFIFGPADEPYRQALTAELGKDFPQQPLLSLPELAYTLKVSRALVSCDTGPLHLAAVLDVPVVAMLGPSNPILNQPDSSQREVILPGVACAPCRQRDCQVLICQDATTPSRVFKAVMRQLNQAEGAA